MKMPLQFLAAMIVLAVSSFSLPSGFSQSAHDEIGYQMKVQRACEAAIWAMPAVSVYDIELSIQRDLGGQLGDVAFFTKPMNSRHGFLTANDVTPYVTSGQSCQGDPLVVEVPPTGEKASFFGTFVDAWQTPIADVGPPGQDEGKGGKYLFLPPDFDGEVPDGYFVHRPNTFGVHFAFRPVARNGGSHADQAAYAQTLKVYRLSEAGNPPKTSFIDAYPKKWNTLPVYDLTYFTDLDSVIQREPVLDRDKAMMAVLAGIGMEKGKEFHPDAETKRALQEGLDRAYAFLQNYFTTPGVAMVPLWEGKQWQVWKFAKGQAESGFPYVDDNRLLSDERAGSYFFLTYLPRELGPGTFYLTGLRDKEGTLMNGTDTYRLNVPADTPAKDFWSVIPYSMKTKGFIEDAEVVGLASAGLDKMQKNDDGSVDVFFAPKAPKGKESNWIPTGEDFFLLFRLYGPDKALFDKTWILGDVEKVK